jgi:PTS system nitrogen regulatory IIA component
MNLKKVITEDAVILPLKAVEKNASIEELVDLLVATGRIKDRSLALKDILEREAKMSTGMQNGLALPHAKTDAVDRLVAAVGIKPGGIEFQSIDGQPSTVIILTLSPLNRAGPHIQFLAEIGRLIGDAGVRSRLLTARSAADVAEIFAI